MVFGSVRFVLFTLTVSLTQPQPQNQGAIPANRTLPSWMTSLESTPRLSLPRPTSRRSRPSRASWGSGRCTPFYFGTKATRWGPSWGPTRTSRSWASPTAGMLERCPRRCVPFHTNSIIQYGTVIHCTAMGRLRHHYDRRRSYGANKQTNKRTSTHRRWDPPTHEQSG